jgi:hypothetical protein
MRSSSSRETAGAIFAEQRFDDLFRRALIEGVEQVLERGAAGDAMRLRR